MGISTLGVSVCGLAFVPLTHFLISNLGWRNTLVVLGIIVWGLTVIPGGDYPDPVDVETENFTKTATISAGEQIWTLRGALRTKALWLLLVGFNLAGLSLSGVLIHLFSYL